MLDPGDEVIVPAPYWTTYPEAIQLAGGVAVPVLADETQEYKVTVEQLEAARTERTKVLLFVSPSNPTGAVYTSDEIRAIGAVGRGPRPLGADRRDLRAPGVRRRRHRLAPGPVPRARRPHGRRQRCRQDLCHDRLARRLAHRSRRHRQGGCQPAVARDVQRLERRPARGPGRGDRRPLGGGGDEGRVRPTPEDHRVDAERDRRRRLPDARGRVLRLPVGQGTAGRATTTAGRSRPRPTSRSTSSSRPRWRSCRARRSEPPATSASPTHSATKTWSRGSPGCRSSLPEVRSSLTMTSASATPTSVGRCDLAEGASPSPLHRLDATRHAARARRARRHRAARLAGERVAAAALGGRREGMVPLPASLRRGPVGAPDRGRRTPARARGRGGRPPRRWPVAGDPGGPVGVRRALRRHHGVHRPGARRRPRRPPRTPASGWPS